MPFLPRLTRFNAILFRPSPLQEFYTRIAADDVAAAVDMGDETVTPTPTAL